MQYNELKEIQQSWKGKICLFGAGLIGGTWAYDILKEIGFQIDFYCDNNKEENIEIREGIKTISLDMLYSLKDRVLVFITVTDKHIDSVRRQLEENGIRNVVEMGNFFMQIFIESLLDINNKGLSKKFSCILDDVEYICRQYKYRMGYSLNLDNPQTFNEKIQWLKLYDRNPDYVQMVDKYEVKKYVADRIGEKYIIPTLGIYDTFDEIEFDKFPQQFVLKCTHDSGSIVICRNKDIFNRNAAKDILENALKRNFYWAYREWPYKNVKPRIIAEKYMTDESNYELKDYKFFNFNGKSKIIQVDYDRFIQHKRNVYTTDWKYIDAVIKYPTDPEREIACPQELEKMIEISEALSKGIPHVRTDLYCINNKIYFGELTFHHGAGYEKFIPKDFELELGNCLKLPI